MTDNPIIYVKELSKHFKVHKHYRGAWGSLRNLLTRQHSIIKAVDEISFTIESGELIGYIGPNGAGKSTTIKMLTGLLVPSSGDILVNNCIPWKDREHYVAKIGSVFGQRTTLWWDLPVIESLTLLKYIYKIPPDRFEQNIDEFRKLLDLDIFIDSPVRALSLGQRMRADICAALLHDPDIIFLDEPTIGLDVVAKERIREFISHINQERGTTIVLTTHDLSDVEILCQRVMIIDHGKLLFDGHLSNLQEQYGDKRELIVDFSEEYSNCAIPNAQIVNRQGLRITYQFNRDDISASALIGNLTTRYRIRDLSVREPDIETTIRRIYEERLLDR